MRMTNKEIPELINEIFQKSNFVANVSIVLPQGDVKTLLDILPSYAELFKDKRISWRVTDVKGEGVMLEIDKTNYPHWERKRIIKANEIEYKINKM